jgi:phasin family protein
MMTKTTEQFLNPSKIAEDLVGKLKSFAIPGVDAEVVMATQRKNIEALANASRSALDGAHAVGKRQAEILQESMTQTALSLETLVKSGSPFDIAAKQVEMMKDGFEKALGNMRELAEMVVTAQHGAVVAVSDRMAQSLTELKSAAVEPAISPTMKPQPVPAAAATSR